MIYVHALIIKKRWFFLPIFCLLSFLTNLLLWNEVTQLLRQLPELTVLQSQESKRYYEVNFMQEADETGFVPNHTADQKMSEAQLIWSYLTENSWVLYQHKQAYLSTGSLSDLEVVGLDTLTRQLDDPAFMNDLLVSGENLERLHSLESRLAEIGLQVNFQSLDTRFDDLFHYYGGNALFGLVASSVILFFLTCICYWFLQSILKLLAAEIRLLRLIGATRRQIWKNLTFLLCLPMLLGTLCFFCFVHSLGVGLLLLDYVYLALLHILILALVAGMVLRQLERSRYA